MSAVRRDEPLRSKVAENGPVRAWLELEPAAPRLSDLPVLRIVVDAAPGVVIERPRFGELVADFRIRDFREPRPQTIDGRERTIQEYVLEPQSSGTQIVLPFPIGFLDRRQDGDGQRHVVETESLTIEVASLAGDATPSLTALAPAERPVAIEAPTLLWWPFAAGGLSLALFVTAWLRRQRLAAAAVPPTPLELAERELALLLARDPDGQGDVKLFFVELTAIVRRHVERTTSVHAPEQTTEEFLRAIQGHPAFDAASGTRLRAFLEAADLVKFGGQRPHVEAISASVARAREFLHELIATGPVATRTIANGAAR
ncbi:MAG: hypothetical protein EXS13_04705 [Planctomycetes bacterium]|nr:hypothetical protein [Planctomycetota bacterium]